MKNRFLVLAVIIGTMFTAGNLFAQKTHVDVSYHGNVSVATITTTCDGCAGKRSGSNSIKKGKNLSHHSKRPPKKQTCEITLTGDNIQAGQTGVLKIKMTKGCLVPQYKGDGPLYGTVSDGFLRTGVLYKNAEYSVSALDTTTGLVVTKTAMVWVSPRDQTPTYSQYDAPITIVDNGCKLTIESSPTSVIKGRQIQLKVVDSGDCHDVTLEGPMSSYNPTTKTGLTKRIHSPQMYVARAKNKIGGNVMATLFVVPMNNPDLATSFINSHEPPGYLYQTQPDYLLKDYYHKIKWSERTWEGRNWWWQAIVAVVVVGALDARYHWTCHMFEQPNNDCKTCGSNGNNNNNTTPPHNSPTGSPGQDPGGNKPGRTSGP